MLSSLEGNSIQGLGWKNNKDTMTLVDCQLMSVIQGVTVTEIPDGCFIMSLWNWQQVEARMDLTKINFLHALNGAKIVCIAS